MVKRVTKPKRGVDKMMVRDGDSVNSRKVQAAIEDMDKVVVGYEERWGVDRLPTLVDEALRTKFFAQLDRVNSAISLDVGSEVRTETEAMSRAYAKLEQVAKANGHEELCGEFWEAPMPDGKVLAITRTFDEQHKVSRENRDMVVYCVEEVANILANWQGHVAVTMAKHAFPGAEVAHINEKQDEVYNDELPF